MHYTSILIIINIHGIKDDIVLAFTFMWTGQNQRTGETTNQREHKGRHQPDRHPAVLQIQAEKGEQSEVKTREVNNKEKWQSQCYFYIKIALMNVIARHHMPSYAMICHQMSSYIA